MSAQYMRIETALGGLGFTRYQMIRKMRSMIAVQHRGYAWRGARKRWYREMFQENDNALSIYRMCMYGP